MALGLAAMFVGANAVLKNTVLAGALMFFAGLAIAVIGAGSYVVAVTPPLRPPAATSSWLNSTSHLYPTEASGGSSRSGEVNGGLLAALRATCHQALPGFVAALAGGTVRAGGFGVRDPCAKELATSLLAWHGLAVNVPVEGCTTEIAGGGHARSTFAS